METFVIVACCVLGCGVIGLAICALKWIAVQDFLHFCDHQVDDFPIEAVHLLSKKEVESLRFKFVARVLTGEDQQKIHDAIVKLKGCHGQILQQAYDFAVFN